MKQNKICKKCADNIIFEYERDGLSICPCCVLILGYSNNILKEDNKEDTNENTLNQIELMKAYAVMMLERGDWHGLWDAAIDLQRLHDKLEKK